MCAESPSLSIDSPTVAKAPSNGARTARSNIQVLIPAFNEEVNLPHALRSVVGWADRVFVVDSESTDRTRDIAKEFGAEVVVQKWLGYARQKNWALDNLPIDSDWVFLLDADEAITPELRDEMVAIAAKPAASVPEAGFYVNRLTYFMGSPIRHAGFFPSYNLRLFKRGRARYEQRDVHEHMLVDGPTTRLERYMLHEDRRGLEHFIAKHNRYSTLEARELLREQHRARGERAERLERGIALRRWLKRHVLPRLPLSGVWRFIYMYFFRLGILDGAAGLRFCLLLSTYDFFISLKLNELRLAGADRDVKVTHAPVPFGLAVREGAVNSAALSDSVPTKPAVGATDGPVRIPAPVEAVQGDGALAAPPRIVPRSLLRSARGVEPSRALLTTLARDGHHAFTEEDVAASPAPPVSVIILAYNEEANIEACLDSCRWCDDVHVLDSGSNDRTREISERFGATVHVNGFRSFGQQRNWAIDHISTRHRWQFQLDADERFTPSLVAEMALRVREDGTSLDGVTAYQNPSMLMFMDKWLRHAAEYPVYQVRLFDKEACRFEDYGHGQREVNSGATGVMIQPYLHFNFSKGVDEWIEKHNRYSHLEASQALSEPRIGFGQAVKMLFSSGSVQRRRVLKRLSYRLPFRTTLIMLYQLFGRAAFLDGSPGWNYIRLRSIYEAMAAVKIAVLKHEADKQDQGPAKG